MPKVTRAPVSSTKPKIEKPKTDKPAKTADANAAAPTWGPKSASDIAKAQLDAAKADGLSPAELKATFDALSAQFGPEVANQTLKENLGAHLPELTLDSVKWIQSTFGSMDNHIERYQEVLGSYLQGAQLMDSNFNGKIDATDLAFTKGANGTVNTKAIGQAMADRTKINAAIVSACNDLAKANHKYTTLPFQSFNRDMWQGTGPVGTGALAGVFKLKPGVKPSDAINDIFNNPKKYKFECATALVIAYHKAILDLIGPKDFDKAFTDLKMGPWKYSDTFKKYWGTTGSGKVSDDPKNPKPIGVGQYAYIKNWQVGAGAWFKGWQGENVISLGGDKFYGHLYGITTGAKMIEEMNDHRSLWAKRSTSMTTTRGEISTSVLQLDKTVE